MFAMVATNSGKAMLQIAAIQKLIYDLGNDSTEETIALAVAFLVLIEERIKVPEDAFP